jgi:hypothetical protein
VQHLGPSVRVGVWVDRRVRAEGELITAPSAGGSPRLGCLLGCDPRHWPLHDSHREKCPPATLRMTGMTGPETLDPRVALHAISFVRCRAPSPVGATGATLQAWDWVPCADGRVSRRPPAAMVWHACCSGYANSGDPRARIIGLGRGCCGASTPFECRRNYRTIESQPSHG